MFRLSTQIAKLEDRWGKKLERRLEKYKGKWKLYLPLGLSAWYFYGMFINSIRLGNRAVFGPESESVTSIWVVNPFFNLLAVFTPTGLAVTLVGALLICLITKKGDIWFSGYKYIHDKRGFDILPDGTHGTSGFMSKKEQAQVVLTGSIQDLDRTILGKQKDSPDDDDKYAEYITLKPGCGLTEHTMIYGATGSGKTRGFVKPFILQTARRKESMVLVDPKGEIYESKIIPDEHPSFGRLRDVRVSSYIPHWRQEEERPAPAPATPKETAAPPERPAPAPGPVPALEPERAALAREPVTLPQQFDYGLLSPELADLEGPEIRADQDAPYGAFDLIETLPQDVGGNHNEEGQR